MAQRHGWHPDRAGWLGGVVGTWLACSPSLTLAQIAGDGTLGTQVNGAAIVPCTGVCTINGGTTRGGNLFHSFGQFSLPQTSDSATFQTTPAIQTVIVRVTGVGQPFISTINGTIGTIPTSNPVNFFLLNPNGITFGSGARLNIGGSFLATTANRMQFADGTALRTHDPTPLLTISVPIGLQFGQTPGEIRSRLPIAAGINGRFTDFVLVGGDVTLDRSFIGAPGRRVALGAVGENGLVQLQVNGDRLNFSLFADTPRRDVTLTNRSIINNGSINGQGEIAVTGRNITLNQSFILTGILSDSNNAVTNQAGNITIDATANLHLTAGSAIANEVGSNAIGQGGNISITAAELRLLDGSNIATRTGGGGKAGNVQVTAHKIFLDGVSPTSLIGSGIGSVVVGSRGGGQGGDVMVNTGALTLTRGATITSSTFGRGNAGNVRIIANTIALDGSTPEQFSAGIASQVAEAASGRGGNIIIETDSLTATNGANISASTFGRGDAGNVHIAANTIVLDSTTPDGESSSGIFSSVNAKAIGRGGQVTVATGSLSLTKGAVVSAKTFGQGDAGNVQITAGTITLDGTTPDGQFASSISSEVSRTGTGRGGDVMIKTNALNVTNRATVSASAFSQGTAGNLDIAAQTIRLDRGSVIATAISGDGANINLTIGERLLMRRDSEISTSAGLAGAGGNGGNLTINAPRAFLVTPPNENNDITANAFSGNGGQIAINVQGIYGFTPRSRAELAQLDPRLLPTNDITASSQFGVSGVVTINTPDLDPNRGLVQLPTAPTDPSNRIDQSCASRSSTTRSRFTATGRGGLPSQPDDSLNPSDTLPRLATLPTTAGQAAPSAVTIESSPIAEAQTAIRLPNGKIHFVVQTPTPIPYASPATTVSCASWQPVAQSEVKR